MIPQQECMVGQPITFSGYADDYGKNVSAVEFSLDEGKTWVRHELVGSDPDQATMWEFSYTPKTVGNYRLHVRAVSQDGRTSPTEAYVTFVVHE